MAASLVYLLRGTEIKTFFFTPYQTFVSNLRVRFLWIVRTNFIADKSSII